MKQEVLLAVEGQALRHVHRRQGRRESRAVPVEDFQEGVLLEFRDQDRQNGNDQDYDKNQVDILDFLQSHI